MNTAEEKRTLRKTIRKLEAQLSPNYKTESARKIAFGLIAMPEYRSAQVVSCFAGTAHEIDTGPILANALRSGKRLCLPLCLTQEYMEMRYITALEQLTPGTMGILEPGLDAPKADMDEIDLVVLPCLSCNHRGHRLGYGRGYYDRFLSQYRGAAVLLCREQLIRQEIPLASHDQVVSLVLTERGLYEDGAPVVIG